jgi:calcium-dependent protein kinase
MGTNQDFNKLREAFMAMDKNKDGKISVLEMRESLKIQLGSFTSNSEEIESLIGGLDTDGSGFIDYSEFITSAV